MASSIDSHLANVPNAESRTPLHICETRGVHCLDEWMVEEGSHNSGGGTSTTATHTRQQHCYSKAYHRDEVQ